LPLQLENQEDNGPTTLISHLNDPNNEAIVQDEIERAESVLQSQKSVDLPVEDHNAYTEENLKQSKP
jgi:hypothetical protein